MCARRTGEYEEEVCGSKKEEEPQRQLMDTVFILEPRIVLRRADVSEYLPPEWQHLMYRHIKEEEEGEGVLCIKEEEEEFLHMKEEEQEEVIQVPSTDVHLKSEEDGQSEERLGAETPESESAFLAKCVKTDKEFFSGSRCYPGTTFKTTSNSSSDGDHCGGSQIDDDNDDHEQSEVHMPFAAQSS